MPLLRRLWSEDDVHHEGTHFRYDGVSIHPRPLQQPLEMWVGGNAHSALVRTGRLSDGWLPAMCTPTRRPPASWSSTARPRRPGERSAPSTSG